MNYRTYTYNGDGVHVSQTFDPYGTATPPEFERRYFYDTESAWQDGARSPRE
jgi:hypothetical protein